jgi:hypothetical protein
MSTHDFLQGLEVCLGIMPAVITFGSATVTRTATLDVDNLFVIDKAAHQSASGVSLPLLKKRQGE